MPAIRPISDLRNHTEEVSSFCHKEGAPVFITKNGKGDLVVMSQAAYDQLLARLELYGKLEEAARDARIGDRGIGHKAMMERLHRRVA